MDLFTNKSIRSEFRIGYESVFPDREQVGLGVTYQQGRYAFKISRVINGEQSELEFSLNQNGGWLDGGVPSYLEKFKFYRFSQLDFYNAGPPDYLAPPTGNNLLGVLLTNESLQAQVSELCASVGLKLVLKEAENTIELQKEYRNNVAVSFPFRFTSEGIQQSILVLSAMYSNAKSVIAMEEPEVHAFPYNSKILAEAIGLDERENQYFLSTHSPYFLASLLEKTPKKQIAVFVTSFADQETHATKLNEEQMGLLFEAGSDAFFNLQSIAKV